MDSKGAVARWKLCCVNRLGVAAVVVEDLSAAYIQHPQPIIVGPYQSFGDVYVRMGVRGLYVGVSEHTLNCICTALGIGCSQLIDVDPFIHKPGYGRRFELAAQHQRWVNLKGVYVDKDRLTVTMDDGRDMHFARQDNGRPLYSSTVLKALRYFDTAKWDELLKRVPALSPAKVISGRSFASVVASAAAAAATPKPNSQPRPDLVRHLRYSPEDVALLAVRLARINASVIPPFGANAESGANKLSPSAPPTDCNLPPGAAAKHLSPNVPTTDCNLPPGAAAKQLSPNVPTTDCNLPPGAAAKHLSPNVPTTDCKLPFSQAVVGEKRRREGTGSLEKPHGGQPLLRFDDVLSSRECAALVLFADEAKFGGTANEYPAEYRNNTRQLWDSHDLAKTLWSRILPLLSTAHVAGVRPSGLANTGVWSPVAINSFFRVSCYSKGERFARHRDVGFCRDDVYRSALTGIVYLTGFGGGQTLFWPQDVEDGAVAVGAKVGSVALFHHDVEHAGAEVTSGRKIILRFDVMFFRHGLSLRELSDEREQVLKSEVYYRMRYLYRSSVLASQQCKPIVATDLFVAAADLLCPTMAKPPPHPWTAGRLVDLGNVHLFAFWASFAGYKSVVQLGSTCRLFQQIASDSSLWRRLYAQAWPAEHAFERSLLTEVELNPVTVPYSVVFRQRLAVQRGAGQFWLAIDIGSETIRYKIGRGKLRHDTNDNGVQVLGTCCTEDGVQSVPNLAREDQNEVDNYWSYTAVDPQFRFLPEPEFWDKFDKLSSVQLHSLDDFDSELLWNDLFRFCSGIPHAARTVDFGGNGRCAPVHVLLTGVDHLTAVAKRNQLTEVARRLFGPLSTVTVRHPAEFIAYASGLKDAVILHVGQNPYNAFVRRQKDAMLLTEEKLSLGSEFPTEPSFSSNAQQRKQHRRLQLVQRLNDHLIKLGKPPVSALTTDGKTNPAESVTESVVCAIVTKHVKNMLAKDGSLATIPWIISGRWAAPIIDALSSIVQVRHTAHGALSPTIGATVFASIHNQ